MYSKPGETVITKYGFGRICVYRPEVIIAERTSKNIMIRFNSL